MLATAHAADSSDDSSGSTTLRVDTWNPPHQTIDYVGKSLCDDIEILCTHAIEKFKSSDPVEAVITEIQSLYEKLAVLVENNMIGLDLANRVTSLNNGDFKTYLPLLNKHQTGLTNAPALAAAGAGAGTSAGADRLGDEMDFTSKLFVEFCNPAPEDIDTTQSSLKELCTRFQTERDIPSSVFTIAQDIFKHLDSRPKDRPFTPDNHLTSGSLCLEFGAICLALCKQINRFLCSIQGTYYADLEDSDKDIFRDLYNITNNYYDLAVSNCEQFCRFDGISLQIKAAHTELNAHYLSLKEDAHNFMFPPTETPGA